MAIVSKSLDEITEELCDIYDSLIAPKKIHRNSNNKLFLFIRAIAAGNSNLIDSFLALRYKFDPAYCEDIDLISVAKLVGTEIKLGSGSMLRINIQNSSDSNLELQSGTYKYQSIAGDLFSFEVKDNRLFRPNEVITITAISDEKGSYHITRNRSIVVWREDSGEINPSFQFSCEDNIGQLGYPDEDLTAFRTRILTDTERQDSIKELELKIRNKPNIFECSIIFNEEITPQTYEGIEIPGKNMLITLEGVPDDSIAEEVCKSVIYDTCQTDADLVVFYHNDLFLTGKKPVYYRFFDKLYFSIKVVYSYNSLRIQPVQVEEEIDYLFAPYKRMVTRLNTFSEKSAYKILEDIKLPSVEILNVDILDSSNRNVSFIDVPKTKLLELTNIEYESIIRNEVLE